MTVIFIKIEHGRARVTILFKFKKIISDRKRITILFKFI